MNNALKRTLTSKTSRKVEEDQARGVDRLALHTTRSQVRQRAQGVSYLEELMR